MKTTAIKGIIIPLFVTLLCLILLTPTNVKAQDKPVKNTKTVRVERAMVINQNKKDAKLTDDQKAKIKDLRLENMKDLQSLKAKSEEIAAHLKTLNVAEKPDNKAVFKTIDEMVAVRGDIMKREFTFKQSVKALLTPDQLKELQLRQLNKRPDMGGRNQKWGRQGNRNFGHGQMMQRGGMNRPGQMQRGGMNRPGQMMQRGGGMNRPGQMMQHGQMGQGMNGQMPQVQMQKRFQMMRQAKADSTKVK
jgi:Spy/CpxP family protein refolding chaperone